MSHMVSHGLQLAPRALLLLYDQDYKAWCHGGHGTSCSSCVDTVLTAHASLRRLRPDEGLWCVDGYLCIVLATRKPFPKGCHLGFGEMGGRLGLLSLPIYSFSKLAMRRLPMGVIRVGR